MFRPAASSAAPGEADAGTRSINDAPLDQLGLFQPAFDTAVQDFFVELDRAIKIADPKHDMVEPSNVHPGLGTRSVPRLDPPCVRHSRLLSLAMDHSTANRRGRQSDYCGAGWDGCVVAWRGCWLRHARISARSRTPSWLVSIWSKRAPARCPARSWTRCRYCSRVMPPVPEGAGGGEVELSMAAVCGLV